jgi:hypothetical protein
MASSHFFRSTNLRLHHSIAELSLAEKRSRSGRISQLESRRFLPDFSRGIASKFRSISLLFAAQKLEALPEFPPGIALSNWILAI